VEFKDQYIVLHEATVAAIARAYISIVTHPQRRAIKLVKTVLSRSERKQGYSPYQLVEAKEDEDQIIREALELLERHGVRYDACRSSQKGAGNSG